MGVPSKLAAWTLVLLAGATLASNMGYALHLNSWWLALVFLVVGPILEEYVFRHQLQQWMATRFKKPWLALLASSVLFALCHMPWMGWAALALTLPGALLGWCWMRFGKLTYNVALHSAMNAALAVVSWIRVT